MLVDDDKDDRFLFSNALKQVAPDVTGYMAEGGQEGLAIIQDEEKPRPDVIFLDINMPGMTGWEFLRKVKRDEKLKKIPVIMYSTSSHERDVGMALDFGAEAYCVKPDDFNGLKTVIEYVVKHLDNDICEALKKTDEIKYFKKGKPFFS